MLQTLEARSILRISVENNSGIFADVADFLKNKGHIVSLQHMVDQHDHQLFMRVKWACSKKDVCDINVGKEFQPIADKYNAKFWIDCSLSRKKLGLFSSSTTHCLEKVLYNHREGYLDVDIPLIIANSEKSRQIAEEHNIPFYFISTKEEGYEKKQLDLLKKYNVDFVGLARYMKILSSEFVSSYPNKIINIHHSFLPSFVGAHPYEEAYERGVKLMGATSHFVIPALDQGPIIQQDVTRVVARFDALSLQKQGRDVEARVFYYALEKYIQNKLIIHKNRVFVFD